MSFKFISSPLIKWPVDVRFPSETEPGKLETSSFVAHWRLPDLEAAQKALDVVDYSQPDAMARETETYASYLAGWDDMVDDDGAPIAFDLGTFRQMMGIAWIRGAIVRSFSEVMGGKARSGN